jgi:hypothetical protein
LIVLFILYCCVDGSFTIIRAHTLTWGHLGWSLFMHTPYMESYGSVATRLVSQIPERSANYGNHRQALRFCHQLGKLAVETTNASESIQWVNSVLVQDI